ncbi:MAG: pyridoxine 5'-phosphate synthase [Planctomycetota bacterium]|nr:pyridoxine 5'-phosphate synthase [Planctomycetota bacterium]
MIELGVNIDHVATVRQARRTYEPDPAWAAAEAQLAGADCITIHLREDRRHVQDHDLTRVAGVCHVPLNLEMAATDAMVAIALQAKPRMCTLVPEGRQEVTTEGGLDVAGQLARLTEIVGKLKAGGILVSMFIDARPEQVDASAKAGAGACEIHTGPYAHLFHEAAGDTSVAALAKELKLVGEAGRQIIKAGMRFNAGHALNYRNVGPIAALSGVWQLHIGHSIVSRAIFVGMREAVREMKRAMAEAAGTT